MLEWLTLLPIVFPFLAAAIFARVQPRAQERARDTLFIFFLLLELILVGIAGIAGARPARLAEWNAAGFSLTLAVDGVAFLLLILACLVPLILSSVSAKTDYDPFIFLFIGALAWITSAASAWTIIAGLLAFDAIVYAWRVARGITRETAERDVWIHLTLLLILMAGILIAPRAPEQAAVLITVTLWGRLGLFPFQGITLMRGVSARDLWIARGMSLIAGFVPWLRGDMWSAPFSSAWIAGLSVVASVAILLRARAEEEPSPVASRLISLGALQLPVAIAFGGEAGNAIAFGLMFGTLFALALFEIALKWRAENRARAPRALWLAGLFALAGLPVTPGWLGMTGVYVILWEEARALLYGITVTAMLIAQISLWRFGRALQGMERRALTRRENVALGLMIASYFGFTAIAFLIAPAFEPFNEWIPAALDRVIRTTNAPAVYAALGIVIASPIIAWGFARLDWHLPMRADGWVRQAGRGLEFDWLIPPLAGAAWQMGALARRLLSTGEEHSILWIILAALWISIFILIPR